MWSIVRRMRDSGVTIILTTHYIEEAEEIADRVGVINNGELLVVDETLELMRKLGKKELHVELRAPVDGIPESLDRYGLALSSDGAQLTYTYDIRSENTGITDLLQDLESAGLAMKDLNTAQSSLEDIFVNLVRKKP
jgi:ABC-2 type transport system ATP-binding protein